MAVIRDGEWTLWDSDIQMGRYTWVKHNPDGSMTFRTDYSVDPTVDANTAMRNAASPGWKGDWHKVASVPVSMMHQGYFADAVKADDQKAISKWLNDSDNRAWRSKEGRV